MGTMYAHSHLFFLDICVQLHRDGLRGTLDPIMHGNG
jgi:hypothetical protein